MTRDEDVPLMVLADPGPLADVLDRQRESLRRLGPDEAEVCARTAAEGFGADVDLLRRLVTFDILATPEVRAYVIEVDSVAVATGVGICIGDHVGVFYVATVSAHRRRGLGAAITARAVLDGFAAGASVAWLQSSPLGHPVYEALGFRTVEMWPCWLTPHDS